MNKAIAVAAALTMLSAGAALAQTQTPPGVTCTRTPPTEPGAANGSSGAVKEHFVKGSCEALVMPNGRTEVQNGPAATNPEGTAAPHESP